tara:strand:+ start:2042 stop:2377 length:336 start_codon:yes stop_codon:yes gene_type:complete
MPSIYSFSLDNYKHVELIRLMETTKNRSALIRHALHLVNNQYANREYRKKLEKLVRTYCDMGGFVQPNLQRIYEQCRDNNNVRDFGYSTIEDLQDLLRAHQEDHNSSQEQE